MFQFYKEPWNFEILLGIDAHKVILYIILRTSNFSNEIHFQKSHQRSLHSNFLVIDFLRIIFTRVSFNVKSNNLLFFIFSVLRRDGLWQNMGVGLLFQSQCTWCTVHAEPSLWSIKWVSPFFLKNNQNKLSKT